MPLSPKLLGAAAFSGALALGGAAGALLGTPSVSNAQEEDTTTTTAASDEGSTDSPDAPDGRHPGGCGGAKLEAAADALGISVEELRTALADGSSIADVAEEQGVDVQDVIDALVAEATEHIDLHVEAGDLTAEEAAERKAGLTERITRLVNREGLPRRGPGHHHRHHRFGDHPDDTADTEMGEPGDPES